MRHRDLPQDFNCETYRHLHPDLSALSDEQLMKHFVDYGISEKRAYKAILSDFVYDPPKQGGVNLLGFVNNALGLGATCRLIEKVLRESGVTYNLNQFPLAAHNHNLLETTDKCQYDINIICMNPDIGYGNIDPRYFRNKRNIVLVFWELEKLPDFWVKSLSIFDEIWVGSNFNAETMRRYFPQKEICCLPLKAIDTQAMDQVECKKKLGIDPATFLCLFVFDFNSDLFRKNPIAVIRAFKMAFQPNENCQLIIKTYHCTETAFNYLKHEVGSDKRIILWNEEITKEGINTLMNSCDLYISLHRSEGLGLTMMEALLHGKPVVCTAYSGNLDFCHEAWTSQVKYTMKEVQPQSYYATFAAQNSFWADPDLTDAAEKVRNIYLDYDAALLKAECGRKWIEENYNSQILNEIISARLEKYLMPIIKR